MARTGSSSFSTRRKGRGCRQTLPVTVEKSHIGKDPPSPGLPTELQGQFGAIRPLPEGRGGAGTSASATLGNTRCRSRSMMSPGSPAPATGSQCRAMAKIRHRITETTSVGVVMKEIDSSARPLSSHEPGFSAAMTPIGMPTTSASTSALKASASVLGMTSSTMSRIGRCETTSSPKLPVAARLANNQSCSTMLRSRPMSWVICARSSGVARGPSITEVKSPGTRRTIRNRSSVAPAMVSTTDARRLAMKAAVRRDLVMDAASPVRRGCSMAST